MNMMLSWPWPVTLIVGLGLLTFCYLGWKRSRARGTWIRRTLMAICVILIGATPARMGQMEDFVVGADVFFVVDLTGSMAALDYDGENPRLDGVRHDIDEVLNDIPGAKYSIIAFDAEASEQLPLTSDQRAVRAWAETAQQEFSFYSAGSSVNRPAQLLEEKLERARERNPQNARIVIYMSDGENTRTQEINPDEENADFAGIADLVDAGWVLGYGTEEGGQMHAREVWVDEGDEDAEWIIDPDTNEPAVSRIDETNLQAIADQLGVEYQHRSEPSDLSVDADIAEITSDGRGDRAWLEPILWPIGLALLVLLSWEVWALAPHVRKAVQGR